MRKFYSFVLMAAALLIGTNLQAATHSVSTAAQFKSAWQTAASGDVIKLTADLTNTEILDKVFWLGTETQNAAARSIEIDMNGYDLESNAYYMFVITHGELKITTSKALEGHNKLTHSGTGETFYLTGSTKKDVDPSVDGSNYFTHLVIGANVIVERPQLTTTETKPEETNTSAYRSYVNAKYRNYQRAAISIDALYPGFAAVNKDKIGTSYNLDSKYTTNVYATNDSQYRGVANGLRIDIYGTVKGLRYGIKPNGYLSNVAYFVNKVYKADLPAGGLSPLRTNSDTHIEEGYKIQDGDDSYSAFIHIYPSGKVTALRATPDELVADEYKGSDGKGKTGRAYWGTPTAVYAAGYARWIIEGEAEGASGAIVKSGNLVVNDATIKGTGSYQEATSTSSSNTGEGSGLLVLSDDAWAGSVQVSTNGTTTVSSEKGYAVEEIVPQGATQESKVENITINGGTFIGGTDDQGKSHAIIISETTSGDPNAKVEVYSATVEGEVQVATKYESEAWERLIPTEATDVKIAEDEHGNKTVVVTVVNTPEAIGECFDINDAEDNKNYDLSNEEEDCRNQILNKTLTLGSLTINPGKDDFTDEQINVTLTIAAGHTLIADKVILGAGGYMVVEAGATLIIKGTEGITSTTAEHIVLKATNNAQATFLLNPAVVNNSEPNAKVELYTECLQTSANPYYYKFQEFALPVKEGVKPANNYDGETLYPGQSQFSTSVRAYDYANHKFDYLSSWSQLQPFTNYQMTNNTKDGGITYTFKGKILGNKNRYCQFVDAEGFGYFGNSHLAPINVEKLMEGFDANVEKTVWVYDYTNHKYNWVNEDSRVFGELAFEEIKSMQAFVLYLNEGEANTAPINYENAVYTPAVTQSNAPARSRANDLNNGALIKVVAANGMADNVIVMEKDAYTSNFDNGSDASKLMNENGINLYATTAMGNLSCVADNSIENTLLSFKAGEATEYMLQLGKVFGEDYAIRDNVTGAIINCAEGTEYAFTQEANTLVSGRFELISIAKMPTAIENTDVKASAKGIYTLMGQYLGENFEVLPAGVYVVNGVKVVK